MKAIPAPVYCESGDGVFLPLDGRSAVPTLDDIQSLRACYPGLVITVGTASPFTYVRVLETDQLGKPTRYDEVSIGSDVHIQSGIHISSTADGIVFSVGEQTATIMFE